MLTREDPLVDLKAFRNANFAFGCLFSLVLGTGLYGSVYVIPLFLGQVRGFDSLEIGQTMYVTGVAMFIAAPISGRLAAKIDMRVMLAGGLLAFGISLAWLGHLTSQSSFWEMLWPQSLRGASLMFIMIPVNQLALGTLPPHQIKNASGLYNLMRNLGGAIGLALIATIATMRATVHTAHLNDQVNWGRSAAVNALDTLTLGLQPSLEGNAHMAALHTLSLMVRREALTLTYNDVLWLMSVSFFAAAPLTLLLKRPQMTKTSTAH